MDPTLIAAGVVFLLMLGGGKKGASGPPIPPGNVPTPLPPGTKPRSSEKLPKGASKGHLPKGSGYEAPDGWETRGIWVSSDCQAWMVTSDWYPTAAGLDAYEWFRNQALDGDFQADSPWYDLVFQTAVADDVLPEDVKGALTLERWPDINSPAEAFTVGVLLEVAPLCADTLPLMNQYATEDEWKLALEEWAQAYPALSKLAHLISNEALGGKLPVRRLQTMAGDVYEGPANMRASYRDMFAPVGG